MNRKSNNKRAHKSSYKKINKIILASIITTLAVIIGFSVTSTKLFSNTNAAIPIDGIRCESMEGSVFHIHVKLDIFINGQKIVLPALIGITDNCFYWMHTHDKTGFIHIEAPIKRTFTLGEFFDIWKQKFNNIQILNNTVDNKHPLNVYVNGIKVSNETNFRDISLECS